MKRRSFFAALAALPFVGKLVKPDVITLQPGESITTGWIKPTPGLFPPIIQYASREPMIMHDRFCPVGHGYLIVERGEPPTVLIRSPGKEPIRTLHVLTQGNLDKVARRFRIVPPRVA